jgi:hypothetical protein
MPSRFSAARLRRSASAAERGQAKSGRPRAIGGLAEHLLVLLLCCRGDVTRQVLGLFDGVDRSAICRAIRPTEAQVKPLLALSRAPKISRREAEASSIDGTGQPIRRPNDDATQRADCSGTRKRHTLKTEHILAATGRIVSVSDAHPGSQHDLTLRRAGPTLPRRARCHADSAYQGYHNDHPNLDIPCKKPKRGALSNHAKNDNRGLASVRVAIEHRIGRTKRVRILADRDRNPRPTHPTRTWTPPTTLPRARERRLDRRLGGCRACGGAA